MFSNMNQLYVIHVHGEFRGIVTPFIETTTWSAKVRPWTVHRWRVLAAWHPDGTPNSWMFHIPPNIWGGSIHGGTPFVAGWFIYNGNSQSKMDDLYRGTPIYGKPHMNSCSCWHCWPIPSGFVQDMDSQVDALGRQKDSSNLDSRRGNGQHLNTGSLNSKLCS